MTSQSIKNQLYLLLKSYPSGISEYELIKELQRHGNNLFNLSSLRNQLSLFHTHFILFHHLYLLRDELWLHKKGLLEISALMIIIHPYTSTSVGLTSYDKLAIYYKDIKNLKDTSEQDVNELLTRFWVKFHSHSELNEALDTLELSPENRNHKEIKKQYHRLASQHHPDKGGCKQKFQQINHAMDIINQYFS